MCRPPSRRANLFRTAIKPVVGETTVGPGDPPMKNPAGKAPRGFRVLPARLSVAVGLILQPHVPATMRTATAAVHLPVQSGPFSRVHWAVSGIAAFPCRLLAQLPIPARARRPQPP